MTREKYQALYDKLGSLDKVAAALRIHRTTAHTWLTKAGVKFNPRGGGFKRSIEERRARFAINKSNGDQAMCAAPVERTVCAKPHLSKPRPCVMKDYRDSCSYCEARLRVDTGAKSGFPNYFSMGND